MQSDLDNAKIVGSLGSTGEQSHQLGVTIEGAGVEALLRAISYYKKKNPKGGEEEECVENIFNCLITALVREQQTRIVSLRIFHFLLIPCNRCYRRTRIASDEPKGLRLCSVA